MASDQLARSGGFELTSQLDLSSKCIDGDAYDEASFRAFAASNAGLHLCCQRGELVLRTFPELLEDLFRLLFKLRPALISRDNVRPAYQLNRYLLSKLLRDPTIRSLRKRTLLDEAQAAAGAAAVGTRLLHELAATDLATENVLLKLEESVGATGSLQRGRPMPGQHKNPRGASDAEAKPVKPPGYDLEQRLRVAQALRSYRGFAQLLLLIEKLRQRLSQSDPIQRRSPEVYEIELGSELARILPVELLSLSAAPLKKDFLRRLLGGELLNYAIRDKELAIPMVILVDASHSMAGGKELASKALAIALWQLAASHSQQVSITIFGPRTAPLWQTAFHDLLPGRDEIARVAEVFFGGGTDFEQPISQAIDAISARPEPGGQIVLISDGLSTVTSTWLSRVLPAKHRRQIQILSLLIDVEEHCDRTIRSFSDNIVRWSELAGTRHDAPFSSPGQPQPDSCSLPPPDRTEGNPAP